jgi:hypothetical protein
MGSTNHIRLWQLGVLAFLINAVKKLLELTFMEVAHLRKVGTAKLTRELARIAPSLSTSVYKYVY